MSTDSVARRVAQKEVLLFFASPVAWLFLAIFAASSLFIVFWVESFFARNIADVRPLFEWMPVLLIFLCAALTMRMWSEERRSGTLEQILTQPAGLWLFVLGKFRACLSLLLLALLSTLPLPVTVSLMANLDWGPVWAGYLATSMLGAMYISIGLFVSARTDNPIVSLMGTVGLCGLLYLLGSPALTDFFGSHTGELLRLLGSGSRFDSITRGVLDLRDLCYYLTLTVAFLALNVYSLERLRWSGGASAARHRYWRTGTILLLANMLLLNVWLAPQDRLRLDLTQGKVYSLSPTSTQLLGQLREPLLIRGYFSAKTHPLLAPMVPQLRDLLREYEVESKGKIRVEFVDPAMQPELEKEANERFGIRATPFQVADKYQATLVNSYFNILVQYGSEHETLAYNDLIEVRTTPNNAADILLRNPEYDISNAIKTVLHRFQMGGGLFDQVEQPVELIAYASEDHKLPAALQAYRRSIRAQLDDIVPRSRGKFSYRFIDPDALGGALAQQITEQWGFRPMVTGLDQDQAFYFYLTLADPQQVVQLSVENWDPGEFKALLDSGLKRFASGLTRTVALSLPPVNPQMAVYNLGGPTFSNLEEALSRGYTLLLEDLNDGSVATQADILVVVAPQRLDRHSVYAIDQFLMRGGTVVIATSPFTTELADGELSLQDRDSGLQDWLAHHGLNVGETLVLDEQSSAFPAPVIRQSGGYQFRDVKMLDYPYFIDLRPGGLAANEGITGNLPQLTMAWASPITVEPRDGQRVMTLLRSSERSWLSNDMDIMPTDTASAGVDPDEAPEYGRHRLGVMVQARFDSYFDEPPAPRNSSERDGMFAAGLLRRSPESARIILYSSNDFMDDQVLNAQVMASGTQYLGPVQLLLNTVDWSVRDDELLSIRSRAHFNRTLPSMDWRGQATIEYINYGLAVLWLAFLALVYWLRKLARRRRYARELRA